ncbi:hypothetical protein CDO52_08465 [Nocardiopsis gilva YIM 90087]|uniref:DUF3761 domain-containing protein n=1 Tax=Nocardiopsis gilva YIM 90087 TaxID=1235441 RepID=A0A223S3V5_9ACTN|nr:hypothetical protein [Nocardiopsis gilva]ASU82810.1 hypothetical protein CDO52_08465 [Nocardiopsis gilva YIM 90087]
MTVIRRIGAAAVSAVLVGGLFTATAPAASAHRASVTMNRASCTYIGGSNHTSAWTQKVRGKCKGHAWVRLQKKNGYYSPWRHAKNFKKIRTTKGQLKKSMHKTWRKGKVYRIHHR